MKTVMVIAVLSATSALVPARAQERDIAPYVRALFDNLGLTYLCRDAFGPSHYQSARVIAIDGMTPLVGESQATEYVATMDARFKADARADNPDVTAEWCHQQLGDIQFRMKVERTKLFPD